MTKTTMLVGGLMMLALGAGCGASPVREVTSVTSHRATRVAHASFDASRFTGALPGSYEMVWSDARPVSPLGTATAPQANTLAPEKASTHDRIVLSTEAP
jgi:hypothetical protein